MIAYTCQISIDFLMAAMECDDPTVSIGDSPFHPQLMSLAM